MFSTSLILRFTTHASRPLSPPMTLWCNGQWLDSLDLPSSPTDRGAILGLGLFETLLAIDGVAVFADRHFARLQQACARLGWSLSLPDFHDTAVELLARNDLTAGRARIRLAFTAGSGPVHDLTPGSDRLVWMTDRKSTRLNSSHSSPSRMPSSA